IWARCDFGTSIERGQKGFIRNSCCRMISPAKLRNFSGNIDTCENPGAELIIDISDETIETSILHLKDYAPGSINI
ncbi:MAG: hypothetical protein ABI707_18380, partial [Ferruginibacter sp.]